MIKAEGGVANINILQFTTEILTQQDSSTIREF